MRRIHIERDGGNIMNFNPSVAHVVYAADDKFAEILGVSLVSLYENSKDMEDIIVYVFDSGIKDSNKKKLLSVCRSYNRKEIIFIHAENINNKLLMDVSVDRGSLSQYARIFISSNLPDDLQRVLYLDCDIIVKRSISKLWNLDIQGKIIGALLDAFSKYYRANIGLKKNDVMFNSGVMLIDLNKWKQNEVEKRVMNFILSKHGKVQQGDQGALNAVLSYDTYCFEPQFNSISIFYDFTYKDMLIYRRPPEFYTERQVREAVENPTIIHFTTSFVSNRAWVQGCTHRYVNEWLKYKKMSPWNNEPLWKDEKSKWKQKIVNIYKTLPTDLAVRIAGIIQAYVRPLKNKFRI